MSKFIKPVIEYQSTLTKLQTEHAIELIKNVFQKNLSEALQLQRITAPLFVKSGLGINDDLNGVERPVRFPIGDMNETPAEIVHSLAKWKRLMLKEYNIPVGYGLYTDMNAIRADEEMDNLHSLYVDQWDWCQTISKERRNIDYLKLVVEKIYNAIKQTEYVIYENHGIIQILPEHIKFIHSEELLKLYPKNTPKERENLICEKYGAVFIIGIGGKLSDGKPHDLRAPDYDDWTTMNSDGYNGLNGDIMVWNPILGQAFELSSMGIRVDDIALIDQLEQCNCSERAELFFHKKIINHEIPLSIGGGIGQSRLCMFLLHKAHIGEIQNSIWSDEHIEECKKHNIELL